MVTMRKTDWLKIKDLVSTLNKTIKENRMLMVLDEPNLDGTINLLQSKIIDVDSRIEGRIKAKKKLKEMGY